MLQKISEKNRRLETIEVRTPEELKQCDALIIPGGGRPISLPFFPQRMKTRRGAQVREC